jgi:hypothetical protein
MGPDAIFLIHVPSIVGASLCPFMGAGGISCDPAFLDTSSVYGRELPDFILSSIIPAA